MILTDPTGGERNSDSQKSRCRLARENSAGDLIGGMTDVMMIVPIDSHINKA